jgi:hypothetical protein
VCNLLCGKQLFRPDGVNKDQDWELLVAKVILRARPSSVPSVSSVNSRVAAV